jgi:hypothetical protein
MAATATVPKTPNQFRKAMKERLKQLKGQTQ